MKTFSIICIIIGSLILCVLGAADSPPKLESAEVEGLGILVTLLLIALGITGVSVGNKREITAPHVVTPIQPFNAQAHINHRYCANCGSPQK